MDRRRALMSAHVGTDNPIAPEPIIDINNYLTIEALERIHIQFTGDGCEYCVNGDGNWIVYNTNEYIEIVRRQNISFRGNIMPKAYVGIGSFNISGKCNLKGNCMSMLFGDNAASNYSLEGKNYAFCNLFYYCDIVSVSENFLPATTLALGCYEQMFYYCNYLVNAPALPATTLANRCYCEMFYYCSELNYIKMLATDISAPGCLQYWVQYVSSTGTFVKHPEATWDTTPGALGYSGVPAGWTVVNDGEESEGLT